MRPISFALEKDGIRSVSVLVGNFELIAIGATQMTKRVMSKIHANTKFIATPASKTPLFEK